MVEKVSQMPLTLARLKVGTPEALRSTAGLSEAETRLADLVNLDSSARATATKGRKASAYLQLFGSVLKFLNGFTATGYKPQESRAQVELYKPSEKSSLRIDA